MTPDGKGESVLQEEIEWRQYRRVRLILLQSNIAIWVFDKSLGWVLLLISPTLARVFTFSHIIDRSISGLILSNRYDIKRFKSASLFVLFGAVEQLQHENWKRVGVTATEVTKLHFLCTRAAESLYGLTEQPGNVSPPSCIDPFRMIKVFHAVHRFQKLLVPAIIPGFWTAVGSQPRRCATPTTRTTRRDFYYHSNHFAVINWGKQRLCACRGADGLFCGRAVREIENGCLRGVFSHDPYLLFDLFNRQLDKIVLQIMPCVCTLLTKRRDLTDRNSDF